MKFFSILGMSPAQILETCFKEGENVQIKTSFIGKHHICHFRLIEFLPAQGRRGRGADADGTCEWENGRLASRRLIIEGKQEAFVRNLSEYVVKLGTDITFTEPNWGREEDSGLGSLLEGGLAAGGSMYELKEKRVRAYINATSNLQAGLGKGSAWAEIGVMFMVEGVDGAKSCEQKTAYVIFE